MKLFVTGGTGFIGTHFLRQAIQHPEATIVALRRPGSQPRLPVDHPPLWIEKPMDQISKQDLSGLDALVHLASPGVSPQKASWEEIFRWNVIGLIHLMTAARDAGVRRIIVAGTFAEYGRSADLFKFIPAHAPLEPTYGYAASKAAGFIAAHAFAIENGLELAYLRIFSAYGEGQHPTNFWPSLKGAAESGSDFDMTPGEQIRDYMPVEDVADDFWFAALEADLVRGEPRVRNVGTGSPVTMANFARRWWQTFGASGNLRIGSLPYRPNEVMRFVPLIEPW